MPRTRKSAPSATLPPAYARPAVPTLPLPTDRSGRVYRAAAQTPGGKFSLCAITRRVARATHRPMTSITDTVNGALRLIGDGGGRGCLTWGDRDETLDALSLSATGVTFGPGFNQGVA